MRVRKIDPVLGRQFGGGQQSFWVNVPDAPAQCVLTRLGLWVGDWYLNVDDGTPWATQVIGRYTGSTRDAAVCARILGTPGVSQITLYSSSLNTETRRWTMNATVETLYGTMLITAPI